VVGADKGILGNIFCLVSVAQEEVRQAENSLLVSLHQSFPGRSIALLGAADQISFTQVSLSGEVF
jgi:hypothetical protein